MVLDVDVFLGHPPQIPDRTDRIARAAGEHRRHLVESQQIPVQLADIVPVGAGGIVEQLKAGDVHRMFA